MALSTKENFSLFLKQKITAVKSTNLSISRLRQIFFTKKFIVIFFLSIFPLICLLGFLFIDKKIQPNLKLTDLPYQEKIAEGVYELKNREPIKQTLAQGKKADLNLKKSSGSFQWNVKISSGTNFYFGKKSEEGIRPIVRIVNKEGWFVQYSPKEFKGTVNPVVQGNVVKWEIADGIMARYAMMQDRVKADYIINDKSNLKSNKLEFDVISGQENSKSLTGNESLLKGEVMPGGDIDWYSQSAGETGPVQTQFTFPAPVVHDSKSKQIPNTKYQIQNTTQAGQYSLAIVLDPNQLAHATWPLTIDPVVIDAAAPAIGTANGNARMLLRDGWGNLVALVNQNTGDTSTLVYFKAYTATTWTDAGLNLDGSTAANFPSRIAGDFDGQIPSNIHVVFRSATNDDLTYKKLTVARDGANAITSIAANAGIVLDTEAVSIIGTPSLIVANKGGGAGVEKIAVAYAMNATSGTIRNEIRFMQCDVADDCTTAANWKNASEEINGSSTCAEGTSGAQGLPNATTCKGTADKILATTAAYTTHHAVLTQLPGKPKRNPTRAVKDVNGTLTDLSPAATDDNIATTGDINGLTTTDYIKIGDANIFSKIVVRLDPGGANINAALFTTREYCSANSDTSTTCDAWSSLSNFVDNTANATITLKENGSMLFDEPSNWVKSTENGGSQAYFIRIRPSAALYFGTLVADFYVNDRNSKALMVVGGVNSTNDLGASYVPWDEISNAGWENNPASVGAPWRENIIALSTTGFSSTTFTNFPLSAAVDYINNRAYVAYMEGTAVGSSNITLKSIPNNLDPSIAANWTDTLLPATTEAAGTNLSLTTDGQDLYMFYVLNPGTNSLVWQKCSPQLGGVGTICDYASDWGSAKTLDNTTDVSHPQAVVTKVTGDTIAIDVIYTKPTALNVSYERHYVDLADKTVVVAASGDDAVDNLASGTEQQTINGTTVKVGKTSPSATNNHAGFRFANISVVQGAAISSAYIDLRVSAVAGTPSFTIYGEDTDTSSSFAAVSTPCDSTCLSQRTRTTSNYAYSTQSMSTNTYRFDITDIVQEIVCRGAANSQPCVGNFNGAGSWASGNAVSILFINTNAAVNQNFDIVAFDDATTTMLDPTIQINCVGSCTTASPPNTTWASIGAGGNAAGDVNANWGSRKKLTFDNRASAENLANFPVLVRLNSTTVDYAKTQNSGQDLRFVDADGTTLLKYEIEKWDETGESLVWVKVPQIDLGEASDYIYMYYNNSSGAAGQDATNVWDSNNKGVWHLGDGYSTASNFYKDSTTNSNHGTLTDLDASTAQVDGVVGKAMDFGPRDADFINILNSNSLNNTGSGWGASNPFTLSTWLRFDDTALTYQYMISKDASGSNAGDAALFFNNGASCTPNTARVSFYNQPAATCATSPLINQNQWYFYTFTIDSSNNGKLYQDGVLVATTGTYGTVWSNSTDVHLGNAVSSTFSYTGKIDEVRVSGGIARSADWIEADYLSTKPNSNFVSIAAEQTAVGSTVRKYSLGSAVQLATGSASFANFDHPLSVPEYVAVEGYDTNYIKIPATTVNASQSAQTAFMFKVNNSNNNNTYKIDASAIAKSSMSTSTKPVYLQVYRGGSTNDWVTMAADSNTAGDTDITLTSPSISANTSEYYFNETPGIGTQYAACTTGTANCWTYWRVYQDAPTSSLNEVFSVNYVNVAFAANGPDKVAFSNATRSLTAGACNGAASVFTMELQQGSTPTNPQASTVVRVTSDSPSETIYSDSSCATSVTNGDFTYSTSENSKSVYIIDTGTAASYILSGTRQSGDTLTTGTQTYSLQAAPAAIIRGGTNIRGGTTLR